MSTYICPYCFSKNEEKEILYKCKTCGNEFRETNGSLKKKGKCPKCGDTTDSRRCHHTNCQFELPYTFGSYQDETFSVIGMKDSGKSNFIGMLLREIFDTRISEQFSVSKAHVHDNITDKLNTRYGNLDENKVVDVTRAADEDRDIREALIYTLSFRKKGFMGGKKLKVATMSLFDNAGEDLKREDIMQKSNRCVFNSTGIIMIIDPMQFPVVREELGSKGIKLPVKSPETIDNLLANVSKLIRNNNNTKLDQLINIPIAIALSKSDVLTDFMDDGMIFRESNHREGTLNKEEIMGINKEIENFIITYYNPGFVQQVKNSFRNYCFFGFSALGSNPEYDEKGHEKIIEKKRPLRVEDPFLWLLHQRNLIKMK